MVHGSPLQTNRITAVLQFQKCCLCTRLRLAKALKILVQEMVQLLLQWRERELFAFAAYVISWSYHFTSPVKLLPCAREIPGSSVWMHCFYTLEVLCCCVNHPVRISLRAVGLTKLGVIGCHMLGGLSEKEGLQSFSNRVQAVSLLHHLRKNPQISHKAF